MSSNTGQHPRALQALGARAPASARIMPYVAGAAGVLLLFFASYARTWQSFTPVVKVCPERFCDFVDYYYPMGAAIFKTGLPVQGFLYSPFVAILFAIFPPLGLSASLVLWGILQVLIVSLYVLLFRRLVQPRPAIQLLFVGLTLSSYPLILNFMGGQVSVITTAALLGLLVASERGRCAAAGLLALAAGFKFYPIIFLVPFAARRDMRFLLFAAVGCAAALVGVPSVLLGAGDTLRFYGALLDSFRQSAWVVANPHSQFLPHVALRLANATGFDGNAYLPLLQGITYGVAAANIGLIFLVQRARLRHAGLWSFQILFLTIPFILKTSWPHDFAFLPFTQALLAWRLLEGGHEASSTDTAGKRSDGSTWQARASHLRTAALSFLLVVSIVLSNVVFFGLFGNFARYGSLGFLFWANLLLLVASYAILLPPGLRSLRGRL